MFLEDTKSLFGETLFFIKGNMYLLLKKSQQAKFFLKIFIYSNLNFEITLPLVDGGKKHQKEVFSINIMKIEIFLIK